MPNRTTRDYQRFRSDLSSAGFDESAILEALTRFQTGDLSERSVNEAITAIVGGSGATRESAGSEDDQARWEAKKAAIIAGREAARPKPSGPPIEDRLASREAIGDEIINRLSRR